MSGWVAKKFWTDVTVIEEGGGFAVQLDGRTVKTPAKASLIVPTQGMAQEIAEEWRAQEDAIKPETMPFTRSANAAIDKVRRQHGEVADMIAEYGQSDLLCYRAETPQELVARQNRLWDPYLDWAAHHLNARLMPRTGVIHAPQDPQAIAVLRRIVHDLDAFQLTAVHDLVSLSGSLILGLAVTQNHESPESIWAVSRVDEHWQVEQWGIDEEAQAVEARKKTEFLHAAKFYFLAK